MLSLTFIKRFFLCLTIIISANNLSGQTDFIIVNNITFKGNKKTTDRVVKYEMAIEKGDTLTLKACLLYTSDAADE